MPPAAKASRLRRVLNAPRALGLRGVRGVRRVPLRLSIPAAGQRWVAAGVIALLSAAVAMAARLAPEGAKVAVPLEQLDWALYDSMYRLRPAEDRTGGPVVIVAVDQESLDAVGQWKGFGWPWPRQFWGAITAYAESCGARAVAFDLLFDKPSVYARESDDDTLFAEMVNAASVPVVFASSVRDGQFAPLAPPVENPRQGAIRVTSEESYRDYHPAVGPGGRPSLAAAAVRASGLGPAPPGELPGEPFLMHYYGPHRKADGGTVYRYLSAKNVLAAALEPKRAGEFGIDAAVFEGKIVLVAVIAAGTFDLKFTPLSRAFPGVEVHATAIDNLVRGQQVRRLGWPATSAAALGAALAAALGVVLARPVTLKLAAAAVVFAALVGAAAALFTAAQIRWLPLAAPLLATALAVVLAFAWSYVAEDRNRRFILKAFSQYVSPEIVAELDRDPGKLVLYGQRREMTVLFSDIAGFTDLSETVDVEKLTELLNYYLDEMSGVILGLNGTLDKYIGDSVMSFWSAPLAQDDHAVLACRAALAMRRREHGMKGRLRELGADRMFTRIGINSGTMAVGNMGSSLRFNYTVLGDSVNLGSRLESANKFYGTQILISESTAGLVKDRFVMRQVDLLRVKGKKKPVAVFELIAERGAGEADGPREGQEAGPDLAEGDALWLAERFDSALKSYFAQDWDAARRMLLEIRRRFRKDGPAKTLLRRVRSFRRSPPPADWDGVYVARDK